MDKNEYEMLSNEIKKAINVCNELEKEVNKLYAQLLDSMEKLQDIYYNAPCISDEVYCTSCLGWCKPVTRDGKAPSEGDVLFCSQCGKQF